MSNNQPRKPLIQGEDLKEVCRLMKLQQRVKQFNGDFKIENTKLVCVYCNEKFDYKYKLLLNRHVWSKSHIRNKRALKAKLVTVKANYESVHNVHSYSDDNANDVQVETKKIHKRRLTPQERIKRYVKEFGNILKQEEDNLICTSYNIKLKHNKRSAVERHMASKAHDRKDALKKFLETGGEPPTLRKNTVATAAQQEFNIELCKVFLVAGIPISKLSHPILQRFFNKYTTMRIPDPSTLRRRYLDNARTTLQADAKKLQQERLNNKNKASKTREEKSKEKKGNEKTEEDPLFFTDEQLESMLLLKAEPKEELIDEAGPEVKRQKLKKRKQNGKKEDLAFTDEQLESIFILKENSMDEWEPSDELIEDPLSLPTKELKEEPVEPKDEPLEPKSEPEEKPWD